MQAFMITMLLMPSKASIGPDSVLEQCTVMRLLGNLSRRIVLKSCTVNACCLPLER